MSTYEDSLKDRIKELESELEKQFSKNEDLAHELIDLQNRCIERFGYYPGME